MRYSGPIGGDLLARRYRLIDRVGSGGMSVVWRARDEVLDRMVAVKWLGSELADDDLYRDLVRREAWATARIKHPAVAAVYDYGEVTDPSGQSLAYVVMEMLDGESLSDRLRRGPVPWQETVSICAQVADALATAHEHGVVHRDVSPDNVMLTSSGLRVFDFGIAAPIGEPDDDSTGSTFGTPAYVAPERLDGQPAQTATDVYSLGVLIFEMLTGRPPFPEDTWDADAPTKVRVAPRPRGVPGLPTGIAKLCQRCLSYDPVLRPSAREVATRLKAYDGGRSKEFILAGAAAAVIAAVVIALVTWDPTGSAPSAAQPTLSNPATSAAPDPSGGATPSATVPATPTGTGGSTTSPAGSRPPTTKPVEPTVPSQPPPGGPPVTPPSASAALDKLYTTIDAAVPTGMDSDIANDLRNYVDGIASALVTNPSANVRPQIDFLRNKVWTRWGEKDSLGNRRIDTPTRDKLLNALTDLNDALGYPPLT